MQKTGVLFVVRSFSRTGALPVRFRQIAGYLSDSFDVHILELTYNAKAPVQVDGITVHSLEYSRAGRIFNPEKSRSFSRASAGRRSVRLMAIIKRQVRSLLFPDSVVTEAFRLRSEAVRIAREQGVRVVVLSAFPFSVLLCAGSLRKHTQVRIILDVGDPFYRNSTNSFARDLLARCFERKIGRASCRERV